MPRFTIVLIIVLNTMWSAVVISNAAAAAPVQDVQCSVGDDGAGFTSAQIAAATGSASSNASVSSTGAVLSAIAHESAHASISGQGDELSATRACMFIHPHGTRRSTLTLGECQGQH